MGDKTRVVAVAKNATVLVVSPNEEGGFSLRVDSSVSDEELATDGPSTPERECALAAFTVCDWLRNGHPLAREQKRIIVPGEG